MTSRDAVDSETFSAGRSRARSHVRRIAFVRRPSSGDGDEQRRATANDERRRRAAGGGGDGRCRVDVGCGGRFMAHAAHIIANEVVAATRFCCFMSIDGARHSSRTSTGLVDVASFDNRVLGTHSANEQSANGSSRMSADNTRRQRSSTSCPNRRHPNSGRRRESASDDECRRASARDEERKRRSRCRFLWSRSRGFESVDDEQSRVSSRCRVLGRHSRHLRLLQIENCLLVSYAAIAILVVAARLQRDARVSSFGCHRGCDRVSCRPTILLHSRLCRSTP